MLTNALIFASIAVVFRLCRMVSFMRDDAHHHTRQSADDDFNIWYWLGAAVVAGVGLAVALGAPVPASAYLTALGGEIALLAAFTPAFTPNVRTPHWLSPRYVLNRLRAAGRKPHQLYPDIRYWKENDSLVVYAGRVRVAIGDLISIDEKCDVKINGFGGYDSKGPYSLHRYTFVNESAKRRIKQDRTSVAAPLYWDVLKALQEETTGEHLPTPTFLRV